MCNIAHLLLRLIMTKRLWVKLQFEDEKNPWFNFNFKMEDFFGSIQFQDRKSCLFPILISIIGDLNYLNFQKERYSISIHKEGEKSISPERKVPRIIILITKT